MKRILASLLALCMLMGVLSACSSQSSKSDGSGASQTGSSADGKKLTLMVYMVGSNLESDCGAATTDITEMLNSGVDLSKVNLLVYTGGCRYWHQNISAYSNGIYSVKENDAGTRGCLNLEQTTSGTKNTGEAETLTEFLNYGYKNFPADRYALICWDHGGGPVIGFGADELYQNDALDLGELKSALNNSPFNSSNKLSMIGFDACLMGSVEVGNALKDYAEYMIASEELEPGTGWDYSFLSQIEDDSDMENIGTKIIDSFIASFDGYPVDATLSCVKLSEIDKVNSAMDDLFADVNADFSTNIQSLFNGRKYLYGFGNSSVPVENRGSEPDLVDLGALADSLSADYSDKASALKSALDSYVVGEKSNMDQTSGVTVYYPLTGIAYYQVLAKDTYYDYVNSSEYGKYIKSFTDLLYGSGGTRSVSPMKNAHSDKDKITVTLTDEQKKNFAQAYVNVMVKLNDMYEYDENVSDVTTDRGYSPILLNVKAERDDNGNLVIDPNTMIPVAYSDAGSVVWPMSQIYSGKDEARYQSVYAQVTANVEEYPFAAYQNIVINTALKNGEKEMTIKDMLYCNTDNTPLGKSSVDMDDWNNYVVYYRGYNEAKDDNGNLLPAAQWELNGESELGEISFDKNIKFKMVPVSELKNRDFYYQVVIEDTNGGQSTSQLFPFNLGEKSKDVTEKTDKGEIVYEVFDDRAEVKWYKGSDKKLTIPASFQNKPVTALQFGFFSTESSIDELVISSADTVPAYKSFTQAKIKKVTLPDGVKTIPDGAFCLSDIESINIPSSVESIGSFAFARCTALGELKLPAGVKEIKPGAFASSVFTKGIAFDGENDNYKIDKNALYSKDGKTLYAHFGKETTFAVPDGVETIESWGCTGGMDSDGNKYALTSVTLPGSLKTIRPDAFRNHALKSLAIPDSVEVIGSNAFACYSLSEDDYKQMDSLKIGKGLKSFGREVFGTVTVNTVDVDKDNPYFSSKDGKLMNKAGDFEVPLIRAE